MTRQELLENLRLALDGVLETSKSMKASADYCRGLTTGARLVIYFVIEYTNRTGSGATSAREIRRVDRETPREASPEGMLR